MLACSLESRTEGSDVTTAVYDAFGNLLTVVLPDARQIDHAVNPLNRRIDKKENGALVKTWLYQDGLRPVAEVDDTGHLRARFVYASARNVPDTMITYAADGTEEATYRIITDHLRSVRLVVDASTGAVAQRTVHDVWGNVLEDTNPGFQPFGFAGGLYDADTGLVRFGARDYDAETGRWTAKDPILFNGGQANLYSYVGNDPVNWVDPRGLECPRSFAEVFADTFSENRRIGESENRRIGESENRRVTRDFSYKGPTRLARTAVGAITGGLLRARLVRPPHCRPSAH